MIDGPHGSTIPPRQRRVYDSSAIECCQNGFFFVAKAKSKLVEAEPLVTDIGMTPYRFIWITPNRLSLFRHRLPLRCTWPLLSSTTSLAANGLGPRSAVAPRDRRRRAAGK